MDSKTFLDGNDAKYGADILGGFGMQYFRGTDLRQLPNCLKIIISNPLRNIRVLGFFASQFDD